MSNLPYWQFGRSQKNKQYCSFKNNSAGTDNGDGNLHNHQFQIPPNALQQQQQQQQQQTLKRIAQQQQQHQQSSNNNNNNNYTGSPKM